MELLDTMGSIYTYDRDFWGGPNDGPGAYPGHVAAHGVEIRKQADGRISFSPLIRHPDEPALSTWLKKPLASSSARDLAGVKLLLLEAADLRYMNDLGPERRWA